MSMLNCFRELTLCCKNLLKAQTQNLGNQFSKKYSVIGKKKPTITKQNPTPKPPKPQSTQKHED